MAIPTSTMPGHKLLHNKVIYALDRCQEGQDIDFKESASWKELKWRIIKTSLGMGNLRDGGIIVIGVSERDDNWELTGISESNLKTYEVDVIIDQTNAHVSPHVNLDIVTVLHDENFFLTIQVNEFSDTPLVCKKNGPDGTGLDEGHVYVRPPGMARTTRVTNAQQMHDLLELAAETHARRFLEQARRVGVLQPSPLSPSELFDQELGGL